jgi:protein-L-isoaspartate(D-aspartate) O-methyltransferase
MKSSFAARRKSHLENLEEMPMVPDRDLRARLVAHLKQTGVLGASNVAEAMLAVPRHRFIPAAPIDAAYDDRALAIKEQGGNVLSSISQPSMVAQMLQLLEVERKQRVLEIGTGSGYNAALLAELTGTDGAVVTVEIEEDLALQARARFEELAVANVYVVAPEALPTLGMTFSRIIVTARGNDVEAEWWQLLDDGGRIVVPLSLGIGGERAFGLVRHGDLLESVGSYPCSFIGLRNGGDDREGDVFFLNRQARYAGALAISQPVSIVAMQRAHVHERILERADAVVARAESIFAVTLEEAPRSR